MKQFCLGVIVAIGLTLPAFGQGVDPLIGSWKLNLEKSTYVGSSPPKSQTLTFTGEGQNFIDTVEGVTARGQAFKVVFQDILDGVPHPATGSPDYDSIAFTRFDNTIDEIRFRQGKAVQIAQLLIVPGETLTIITGGMTANDQPFYHVGVYDRR
jgi:hypothetical protein